MRRHNFPMLWAILDKKCGSVHKGAETDVSCHPWVQQLRADMKALWTMSRRQGSPYRLPRSRDVKAVSVAEDERKWRDLVGSLHLVASTTRRKKSHVSRGTQS